MNILIFTHLITGHFLEYIHHIYERAAKDGENQYFFLLPRKFEELRNNFEWLDTPNVTIVHLTDKEELMAKNGSMIKTAWYLSRIVKKYVKELGINKIFLLWLIGLMPFLPILLPSKVKVSGILYRIHLYKKVEQSKFRNFIEDLRMRYLSKKHNIEKIYVLNDEKSAVILNNIYGVDKYRYLPDPVPYIDKDRLKYLREELKIGKEKKIYLHFGAMEERKGTLTILKAIIEAKQEKIKDSVFVFAGRVDHAIKDEFYDLIKIARQKCEIKVYDEFCENDFLYNLCYTCDFILIPYSNTCQSSGVIGYASFFEKPVIGPSKGLLGNLIKDNNLGLAIDDLDSCILARHLEKHINIGCDNTYSKNHTIEAFIKALFV